MKQLRNSGQLILSVLPLYTASSIPLKICYLNARSLHKHIEDRLKDVNCSSSDISTFQKQDSLNQMMIKCIPLRDIVYSEMMVSLITIKDLWQVQLSIAGSNSFLVTLTVLIGMVLR